MALLTRASTPGMCRQKSHGFEHHLTQYFLSLPFLFLNYLKFHFYGLLLHFCLLQRQDGSLRNANVPHQKKCVKVIYILNEVTASTVKCNGRRFTTEINPNEHSIPLRSHKYFYILRRNYGRTCCLWKWWYKLKHYLPHNTFLTLYERFNLNKFHVEHSFRDSKTSSSYYFGNVFVLVGIYLEHSFRDSKTCSA